MRGKRPTPPSWLECHLRAARWLACACIAGAAVLAYHNSFNVPFVFDDEWSILTNSTIRHLWPVGPVLHPPGSGTTVTGRPLLNLSFAVNYSIGGLEIRGYHVLNLAIHVCTGLLLFGILRRTLVASSWTARADDSASRHAHALTLGMAAALMWSVHPLQTESVTYVAQRAESLMGLFYLLTLYCFIRGAGFGNDGHNEDPRQNLWPHASTLDPTVSFANRVWYVLAVVACALGMGTKEVMATAPIVVVLFDRTFIAGSVRQALRQRWAVYVSFAVTWMGLAYLIMTAGSRGGTAGFGTDLAWSGYAYYQIDAVMRYIGLSFWPHPLVFDYGQSLDVSSPRIVIEAIVLLALVAATAVGVWRRTAAGFLGACFFIILAPSSSIVPVATQIMAEHRMYLPLAAVVVMVVMTIFRVLRNLSLVVFGCLIVALCFATIRRNDIYRSQSDLWGDTVAKVPRNAGAHNNLGLALLASGNLPAAIQAFTAALRLESGYLGARSNLGAAFFRAGRFKEAVVCFSETLQRQPDWVEGRRNLGMALASDGRPMEAIVQFAKLLQSRPDDHGVRRRLGKALLQAGRKSEAITEFEQVVQVSPDDIEAQASLGDALLETGRALEAIPHYTAALRLLPGLVDARVNLGNALYISGDSRAAVASYQAALRLQPGNPIAARNLKIIQSSEDPISADSARSPK